MQLGLSLEVTGVERFGDELEAEVGDFTKETAKKIRAEIETSLERGGHSGKIYQKRGRVHIASAPGETPARDTGDLWGSISQVRSGGGISEFEITAKHAEFLEWGTARMEARPFIEPAINKVLEQTLFEL